MLIAAIAPVQARVSLLRDWDDKSDTKHVIAAWNPTKLYS